MSHTESQSSASASNDAVLLTSRERMLIKNFRAMKDSAKHALVDVSEEWAEALPADPVHARQ
jgi:hypothetical protein